MNIEELKLDIKELKLNQDFSLKKKGKKKKKKKKKKKNILPLSYKVFGVTFLYYEHECYFIYYCYCYY